MRKEAAGSKDVKIGGESQWCGSICRTPIAFPLLLVGRGAIETCHGSDDEYREVGQRIPISTPVPHDGAGGSRPMSSLTAS
jgi:hypothetical protein